VRPDRIVLEGDVPSPINPPSGCRFHPRCPLAMEICKHQPPRQLDLDGHLVRCHAVEQKLSADAEPAR
jgi:oligopeptide/dipeptide ABC transporter ATP-binding protein